MEEKMDKMKRKVFKMKEKMDEMKEEMDEIIQLMSELALKSELTGNKREMVFRIMLCWLVDR